MQTTEIFEPNQIEIETEWATSAGGDWLPYTSAYVVADVGDWRCRKPIILREHWQPSVGRAVTRAMDEYGIGSDRVFDLRDD